MLQSIASVCGEFDNMHSDEQNQSLDMQSLFFSCIFVHPLIFSVARDYVWLFVLCIMKRTEEKKRQRNNGRNPDKSFIADRSQIIATQ